MISLNFSRFRNSDYTVLFIRTIAILGKYTADVLKVLFLLDILEKLQGRQSSISLALDKNSKNPFSQSVNDGDIVRDDAIDAFKYFLQYCTKQPVLEIRAAAELLIETVKTYGWSMQNLTNREQTKSVKSFIAEVESKPALLAALQTCSCVELFESIKSTQMEFEAIEEKFNAAGSQLKDVNPALEKEFIREVMEQLILEINYHSKKGTNPEVQVIAKELNTLIESINKTIKARYNRGRSAVAEDALGANGEESGVN